MRRLFCLVIPSFTSDITPKLQGLMVCDFYQFLIGSLNTHWSLITILCVLDLMLPHSSYSHSHSSCYYLILTWLTEPGIIPKIPSECNVYVSPQSQRINSFSLYVVIILVERRVSGLMVSIRSNKTEYITVLFSFYHFISFLASNRPNARNRTHHPSSLPP